MPARAWHDDCCAGAAARRRPAAGMTAGGLCSTYEITKIEIRLGGKSEKGL